MRSARLVDCGIWRDRRLGLLDKRGQRGLVGALRNDRSVEGDADDTAFALLGADNATLKGVLADGIERHAPAVHTPAVHVHGLKLACDARVEDLLGNGGRHAVAIVDDNKVAAGTVAGAGHKHMMGMSVARVAHHLADGVLDVLDVLFCLATLGLRYL